MAQFFDPEAVLGNVMNTDSEGSLESNSGLSSDPDDEVHAKRYSTGLGSARRSGSGSKRKLTYSDDSDSDVGESCAVEKQRNKGRPRSHVTNSRDPSAQNDRVLKELQRSNKLLLTLVKRVENSEK